MKSHIARSGRNAGSYVPCPAKIHCRIASDGDHADFAGQQEMDAYNGMMSAVPEFSDNSMTTELFGGVTPMDADGENPWDDGGEGAYPEDGIGGDVCSAGLYVGDMSEDLRLGESLDSDDYENTLSYAMKASSALWGTGGGISSAKDSDYSAQNGSVVHLDKGWSHRMSAGESDSATMYGDVTFPGHDIFSNGSTALSVENDPAHSASSAIIMSRKHPNVVFKSSISVKTTITPSSQAERIGASLDTIGSAVNSKYGADCSMSIEDGSVTILSKSEKGTGQDTFGLHDLKSRIPEAADAISVIEDTRM